MKAADVLNVKKCLQHQMKELPSECVDEENSIYKITLPFLSYDSGKIEIFAFQRKKSKKILLTDGGRTSRTIEDSPQAKAFMAKFVKHYGLTMMEDESIMELTNRPLGTRVSAIMQALISIDGIHRSFLVNNG